MLTFAKLEPGAIFGTVSFEMNERHLAGWAALFPEEGDGGEVLPPGLVISMMMRGYIHILGERPSGNVHAGQELHWFSPAPRHTTLIVGLKCLRKEFKNERRWVWLENSVRSATGRMHLQGTMRMLWAQ